MEEKLSRWQQIRERLKNTYRLIVLNNETLQEVNTFNLTLQNLYIAMCSLLILFGILVFLLISYTPLKRWVPGYGEISSNRELMALYEQVESLEKTVQEQDLYIKNFRHYVSGDVPVYADTLDIDSEIKTPEPIERVEEDEILRKEVEIDNMLSRNRSISDPSTGIEFIHFVAPIKGTISTYFKPDIEHYGVDILAPKNTAIKACFDGIVVFADWTLQTGNTITIQHEKDLITSYKHNSTILKKAGDYVKAGEAIAIIGNSGTLSNGPHLHFELWQNGTPLDPSNYISFK